METQSTKVVTLNDIVMFSTGSYHLPATGFERKVEINFEHNPPEGKRVIANTCGPSVGFPVSPKIHQWSENILHKRGRRHILVARLWMCVMQYCCLLMLLFKIGKVLKLFHLERITRTYSWRIFFYGTEWLTLQINYRRKKIIQLFTAVWYGYNKFTAL